MTYALIQWGGLVAGQRPRTALAYVWALNPTDGTGWHADLINPDGSSRYKRSRRIDRADILVRFATKDVPSQKLVRKAKQELPIVQENDSRFDVTDSMEE